jgi:dihydropteroate synthase
MTSQEFEMWLQNPRRRPLVMGIVNVTPDSFSEQGRFAEANAAIAHGRQLIQDGADVLDIGGESTRPGAHRVAAEEQIRRIIPVIKALAAGPAMLSVDTTLATAAAASLKAGAGMVNDISAGSEDDAMLSVVAQAGVPIALMHKRGTPASMDSLANYQDVVGEVRQYLQDRRDAAVAAGVARHRILLDPGIGFAKTKEHNLQLLRQLTEFRALGQPLLLGTSRKSFIGRITGESEAADRVMGTAATVAWCVSQGAAIVRVHDVAPMVKVVRVVQAILDIDRESPA